MPALPPLRARDMESAPRGRGGGRGSGWGPRIPTRAPTSRIPDPPQRTQTAPVTQHDPRFVYPFTCMVGSIVVVQLKDGAEVQGIFHTPVLGSKQLRIVLKKAKKVKNGRAEGHVVPPATIHDTMVINSLDFVQLKAVNVPSEGIMQSSTPADNGVTIPEHKDAISSKQDGGKQLQKGEVDEAIDAKDDLSYEDGADEEGFLGDKRIIGPKNGSLFGRQLEKWEPGPETIAGGIGLEEHLDGNSGWDQFAENERRFGVKSTFDENLYTSQLDESKSKYTREDAERIASEIRSEEPNNIHIALERGHSCHDGLDEEGLYAAVGDDAPELAAASPSNTPPEPVPQDAPSPVSFRVQKPRHFEPQEAVPAPKADPLQSAARVPIAQSHSQAVPKKISWAAICRGHQRGSGDPVVDPNSGREPPGSQSEGLPVTVDERSVMKTMTLPQSMMARDARKQPASFGGKDAIATGSPREDAQPCNRQADGSQSPQGMAESVLTGRNETEILHKAVKKEGQMLLGSQDETKELDVGGFETNVEVPLEKAPSEQKDEADNVPTGPIGHGRTSSQDICEATLNSPWAGGPTTLVKTPWGRGKKVPYSLTSPKPTKMAGVNSIPVLGTEEDENTRQEASTSVKPDLIDAIVVSVAESQPGMIEVMPESIERTEQHQHGWALNEPTICAGSESSHEHGAAGDSEYKQTFAVARSTSPVGCAKKAAAGAPEQQACLVPPANPCMIPGVNSSPQSSTPVNNAEQKARSQMDGLPSPNFPSASMTPISPTMGMDSVVPNPPQPPNPAVMSVPTQSMPSSGVQAASPTPAQSTRGSRIQPGISYSAKVRMGGRSTEPTSQMQTQVASRLLPAQPKQPLLPSQPGVPQAQPNLLHGPKGQIATPVPQQLDGNGVIVGGVGGDALFPTPIPQDIKLPCENEAGAIKPGFGFSGNAAASGPVMTDESLFTSVTTDSLLTGNQEIPAVDLIPEGLATVGPDQVASPLNTTAAEPPIPGGDGAAGVAQRRDLFSPFGSPLSSPLVGGTANIDSMGPAAEVEHKPKLDDPVEGSKSTVTSLPGTQPGMQCGHPPNPGPNGSTGLDPRHQAPPVAAPAGSDGLEPRHQGCGMPRQQLQRKLNPNAQPFKPSPYGNFAYGPFPFEHYQPMDVQMFNMMNMNAMNMNAMGIQVNGAGQQGPNTAISAGISPDHANIANAQQYGYPSVVTPWPSFPGTGVWHSGRQMQSGQSPMMANFVQTMPGHVPVFMGPPYVGNSQDQRMWGQPMGHMGQYMGMDPSSQMWPGYFPPHQNIRGGHWGKGGQGRQGNNQGSGSGGGRGRGQRRNNGAQMNDVFPLDSAAAI